MPRALSKVLWFVQFFIFKSRFLRINMDHFGPVIYIHTFINSSGFDHSKRYFVLCCNFPNRKLLELFPNNVVFLHSPIHWLFLGELFFLPRISKHLFPIFDNIEKLQPVMRREDWTALTKNPSQMKGLSHTDDKMPKWLEDFLGRSQAGTVFNREPGCTYTAGHSRRNISLSTLNRQSPCLSIMATR